MDHARLWTELFILSLCVFVSFSARSPASANSRRPVANNLQQRQQVQNQQPPAPPSAARRNEPSVGDQWQGSGDGGDDEDLGFSGDEDLPVEPTDVEEDDEHFDEDEDPENFDEEEEEEEEEEGSTVVTDDIPPATGPPTRTRCQIISSSKPPYQGAYRPQCDTSGAFRPMQCHDVTGECWCVDSEGTVRGIVYRAPEKPTCSPYSDHRPPAIVPSTTTIDDIILVDPKTTVRPFADIKSPNEDEDGEGDNPDVAPVPPKTWYEYILHQPLLLTAVIAGTVLFLIIIVLMLTFCVYRMRKKDEGSYSLDEPRQTFNYTRAKDQEFFA